MSQFFAFAIGLLKPRPDTKNNTTPIQRVADNKLLDLNVLRVIHGYICTQFYFTSKDVAVEHHAIIASRINGVTLKYPSHLCELSDGCIAVIESRTYGGLIRIFRGDVLVKSIGHGLLLRPSGICTNSSNQLIVTDEIKHEVHVFARDGSHINSFGRCYSRDDCLRHPNGVCVNSAGHILVADFSNNRICVFNNDGKFIRTFGSYGLDDGELISPIGIHVDGKDNIYVAEWGNNRVSKFSASGEFLYNFSSDNNGSDNNGSDNNGSYKLYHPRDVCVTCDGKYIIVADAGNSRIQILSGADGSLVASYGSHGSGDKQFYETSGCTVTADGRILVSDYYNKRICEIRKR